MRLRSIALGFVIGALVTAGLSFGVVQASASGASTYYACLSKGKLSHVGTSPATCKFPAVAISWGAAGTDGANVLTSSGSPYGSCVSGNTDIALSTDEVWSCSPNGTWSDTGSSIRGSQGVQGVQGVQGAVGPQGPPGPGPTTYTWSGDAINGAQGSTTFPAGDTINVVSATLNGTLTSGCGFVPSGPPSGDLPPPPPLFGIFDSALSGGNSALDVEWNISTEANDTTLNNVAATGTFSSGALTESTALIVPPANCLDGPATGDVTFNITFTVTPGPTPYS